MINITRRYAPSPSWRGLGRWDQKDESLYFNTYKFTISNWFDCRVRCADHLNVAAIQPMKNMKNDRLGLNINRT